MWVNEEASTLKALQKGMTLTLIARHFKFVEIPRTSYAIEFNDTAHTHYNYAF